MRSGDRMCLDCDKAMMDWTELEVEGTFKVADFFDWGNMNTEATYMKYVREDENHGIGGVNPGFGYTRMDKFVGVIRVTHESEELLNEFISKIPNFDANFTRVII